MKIITRKATKADLSAAHQLIYELAVYEKAAHEVVLTLEQFTKDFESSNPVYKLHVTEITPNNGKPTIVGIALFYFAYSTWKGKMVYLEDLVVSQAYRRQGIGEQLIESVFQFARDENANQVRWHVLDWNEPAIRFYEKLEVKMEEEWVTCKLEKDKLYL
ncbi:MAG: GNAT family N-acetyltransferase [Chitinophagales bacterium]